MYAIGEYSEPHRKPVHPLLVAIGDRPPVIFTDGADDGKAQAVAFHLLGRAVEAVEDEAASKAGSSEVFDTVSSLPDTRR